MTAGRCFRKAVICLLLVHIAAAGMLATLRIVSLVRRYRTTDSSIERWRSQALIYPDVVARVAHETPENARLVVRYSDSEQGQELAHELAFYCFPRQVVLEQIPLAAPPDPRAISLNATTSGTWSVGAP